MISVNIGTRVIQRDAIQRSYLGEKTTRAGYRIGHGTLYSKSDVGCYRMAAVCLGSVIWAAILLMSADAHAQLTCAMVSSYTVGPQPYDILAVDLNGDGYPDIVTANSAFSSGSPSVSVLLNQQDGTLGSPTNYVVGTQPRGLAAADLDNDTDIDVVVANAGSSNVTVLFNNGGGAFPTTMNFAVGGGPYDVVCCDLNGDTYPDIATANTSGGVTIRFNNGFGNFPTASTISLPGTAVTLTCGKFNGDVFNDLAVGLIFSPQIAVLINTGTGTFGPPTFYPTNTQPTQITNCDLDNDGNEDLAATTWNPPGYAAVLFGNGNGTFQPRQDIVVGSNPNYVICAKIDCDDHIDLITAHPNSGTISILSGNGNGTFAQEVDYPAGQNPWAVAVADFNRDGRNDLAVAEAISFSGRATLYLSDCGPDCNNNDIPDSCDIADGTSEDLNGNGIPDECELPPANDLCANCYQIGPGTFDGTTFAATADGASTCDGTNPDVWYCFTPTCPGTVTVSTCGSSPTADTVLSVHTGCPGNTTNEIACNDDALPGSPCAGTLQSYLQFNAIPSTTYRIRVAAFGGNTSPFTLNLSQASAPPPANDSCASAISIPDGTTPFSNCGATTDGPAACGSIADDIWYLWTARCSGPVTIDTCGSSFDTVLAVYNSSPCPPASGSELACNDDNGPVCSGSSASVSFSVTGNTTYLIRVGGQNGATGSGQLTINAPTPDTLCTTCPPSSGFFNPAKFYQINGNSTGADWKWRLRQECCFCVENCSVPGVPAGSGPAALATQFVGSLNATCPSTAADLGGGLFRIKTRPCPGNTTPTILSVGSQSDPCSALCDVTTGTIPPCSFNPEIVEVVPTPAFGLPHFPRGQASLGLDVSGNLVVSNIGSNGEDGAVILIGEAEGLALETPDLIDPLTVPNGAFVKIVARYAMPGISTHFTIENADGLRQATADFTALGTSTRRIQAFCQGVLVGDVTHSGTWDVQITEPESLRYLPGSWCDICTGNPTGSTTPADGTATYTRIWKPTLSGAACLASTLGGSLTVEADKWVISAVGASDVGPVDQVELLATNLSSVEIANEGLQVFGLFHHALGDVGFEATGGFLTLGNIGSSGNDGVLVDLGRAESADVSWAPLDPMGAVPDGAYLEARATGSFNGVPGQPLGTLRITDIGAVMEITADFSDIGSPTQLVQVYSDGNLVASFPGHTGPVGTASLWPIGGGKLGGTQTKCFRGDWPDGTQFVINGMSYTGDELRVLAEGSSGSLGVLSALAIVAADIPEITLLGVSSVPGCLAPPGADCNANGINDECDIADGTSNDLNSNGVPDECEPVAGTCCFGDGGCSEMIADQCITAGGLAGPPGSTCPTAAAAIAALPFAPNRTLECITPFPWLPKLENWIGDQDGNYVEDIIDAMGRGGTVDVVLDLNDCPTDSDLDRFSAFGTIGYIAKYMPMVQLVGVSVADTTTLGLDPMVAMVQLDAEVHATLDVSNPAIKVRTSVEYAPSTVEDVFGLTGAGVNVAILDTGVDDGLHESLPSWKFVGGYNAFTNSEGNPDDDHGHGSHVAGIAIGTGGTSSNIGVAPGAGLVDIKVLNASGSGSLTGVIQGVEKCIQRRNSWNIGVMNLSLGACGAVDGRDALSQAVNRAVLEDIVAVVASGNTPACGLPNFAKAIGPPAAADLAITVANMNDMGSINRVGDSIYPTSIQGPRLDDGDIVNDERKPDVTAPGTNINSVQFNTAASYVNKTGTSMAAPHVAGVAALIIEAKPDITPLSVKEIINTTAEDWGPAGWDQAYGHGYVDAFAATDQIVTCLPTDLRFIEFCNDPAAPYPGDRWWWRSNGLKPTDPSIQEGEPNTIQATVVNNGPLVATDFKVQIGVFNFSNSQAAYDICTIDVPGPLPVGGTLTVSCPWTPIVSGSPPGSVHACLKASIVYDCDSDYGNNCAQHNIDIVQTGSPAEFTFLATNPTDEDLEIHVAHDMDPCAMEEWTLEIAEPRFTMGAFDCPRNITVRMTPSETATGSLPVNFFLIGTRPDGTEILLGGFMVIAQTGVFNDCNANGVDDNTDILILNSEDLDTNGIPDECEDDCNTNGISDFLDIANGTSSDCNANGIPDECDIADSTSEDCNADSIPDDCQLADNDCNANGIPDDCDIAGGTSADLDGNGIPDECHPKFTVNSTADTVDATPGDGVCSDSFGNCTLRAAIMESNALAGPDTINLPAGAYPLTIPGSGEDANATGDLDITDDLTIAGAGAATTLVDAAGLGDRVFHVRSGAAVISGVTISGGSAGGGLGGGIYNGGNLTLLRCAISANSANRGGAVFSLGALTLTESTVNGNTAEYDAGLYLQVNSTITNSTISGNITTVSASSAIYNLGTLTLKSSTIDGNSGGAAAVARLGPIQMENTIVANSIGSSDCIGNVTSLGHNLDSDGSCGLNGPGDLPGTNPMLGPLQNNGGPTETHALLAGSPAIDAVPLGSCTVSTDQRGVVRPQGAACDIGALESQDCNANGIPDSSDIAAGTSQDCNSNGIPDECDIADNTSQDCNADGIPDECDCGWDQTFLSGLMDDFAAIPVDPPTQRSAALDAVRLTEPFRWKDYDDSRTDLGVGHTFTGLPGGIVRAELEIRMQPFGGSNDGIGLDLGPGPSPVFAWGRVIATLPGAGGVWSNNPGTTFVLDLGNLPPSAGGVTNILGALADGAFDVYVQDDTMVDYMQLRVWGCQDCNNNGIPDECDMNSGPPPTLLGARSLATHAAGEFYIDLDTTGNPATRTSEPRSTGLGVLDFNFDQAITAGSITVTPGGATASIMPGAGTFGATGGRATLPAALANDRVYTITINAAADSGCATTEFCVAALVGDFNDDGQVNAVDKGELLSFFDQTVTQTNAKYDVSVGAGDTINAGDIGFWTGFFGTTVAGEGCP